jgi:hypothetical protein
MKKVIIIICNYYIIKMCICTYYKRLPPFACHSKFRFLGVRLGIDVYAVAVLRAEGKSDAWPSGWRKLTYGRKQYLNVVFILSKLIIKVER